MSSASDALRVQTPALLPHVLELAPPFGRMRRMHVVQNRLSDSVAIFAGEALLCVASLFPDSPMARELCLLFSPRARSRMLGLVRVAQLMIPPLADSGVVVVARIDPQNLPGRRMARLAGFLETDAEAGRLWIWRGDDERAGERDHGPIGERCEAGPGGGRAPRGDRGGALRAGAANLE